jgi:hypothetical protein
VDQARDADDVLTTISDLYEGRVGEAFGDAELKSIHAEGATRYALEMPPGYKDASKDVPDRYGDLVIWKQVLKHAAGSSTSAIFVTDDGKEDWWRIFRGKRLGPRPELVDEYFAVSGQRVHFYSPEQFLREAQARFGLEMTDATIGEVQQVSTQRPQRLRLVAERRLQDLETRRENLLKVMDRPSPRSQRSRQLQSHLLAQREDLLQQIQMLESANSVELREGSGLGLDDAKAHGAGIQRVESTTRTRLEKVNRRLRELEEDAPSDVRAEHEGLHRQLEILDAEVLETVEALSEFPGEEEEESLSGPRL